MVDTYGRLNKKIRRKEIKMKIKLLCRDDDKCPADKKPFMLEIEEEAVMDLNNIATVFCPYCNRTMKPLGTPDNSYPHRPPVT